MGKKNIIKLVTKAELARIVGVTAAAITKAARNEFPKAITSKRININHVDVIKYLVRHNIEVPDQPAPTVKKKPPPKPMKGIQSLSSTKKHYAQAALVDSETETTTTEHGIPEEISAFADMTLRELIKRFGTDMAFVDWLKATKAIEDINEKRLKNAVARGELVNRQIIKVGVFDPINETFNKLLTDCSKTISVRVKAMLASGQSTGDCEKFISDQMGSFIRPAKVRIARTLKNT